MSNLSVRFHTWIENNNILQRPTTYLVNVFDKHPTLYKIALMINHLFRAAMMVGFMFVPGIPFSAKMGICFVGSLFYRLTVERNCAYKFALPALAGAMAFMLAVPALLSLINGMAFTSLLSGCLTCAALIPLPIYLTYVLLTVNYDVDETLGRLPKEECCKCALESV
jgi:hypothetical protein